MYRGIQKYMKNTIQKGILIYSKEDYERNQWFANEIILASKMYNLDITLIIIEATNFVLSKEKLIIQYNNTTIDNITFAIIRTINPKITFLLEQNNIKCFNNYETSNICNDKFLSYSLVQKTSVPFVPTLYSNLYTLKDQIKECHGLFNTDNIIVKSTNGHGGKEVFLTRFDDMNMIETIKDKFCYNCTVKLCVQPQIKGVAKDLRVYILGNEIYCSMLRCNPNSYKSNFTLGGECFKYSLSQKEIEIINSTKKILSSDFIGIDYIIDNNNNLIFNEFEDVVGTRMLYSQTNLSPINDYLAYVSKKMSDISLYW